MSGAPVTLDTTAPVAELAAALINVPSPSGYEAELADTIEARLRETTHLEVLRHGNTVAARTSQGLPSRVVWAGHIDTVPANGNDSATIAEGVLVGV